MDPLFITVLNLHTYLFRILAIAGVIGAAVAASTREDAFRAGDRQTKWTWVAILAGSSFALFTGFPILAWVGAVAVGVYWFDVHPQLRAIIRGDYSY